MSEFDYPYLEKLVITSKTNPENSFAEIFAATLNGSYNFIRCFVHDPATAETLLRRGYVQAFSSISQLNNPKLFVPFLTKILFQSCTGLPAISEQASLQVQFVQTLPTKEQQVFLLKHFRQMHNREIAAAFACPVSLVHRIVSNVSRKYQKFCRANGVASTKIKKSPHSLPDHAEAILRDVLDTCGCPRPLVSLSQIQSWENYRTPGSSTIRKVLAAAIIALLLVPFGFVHPHITMQRVRVEDPSLISYRISISSLLPMKEVTGTLNGKSIPVRTGRGKTYYLELEENGELEICAVSRNGQTAYRSMTIQQLDRESPVLVSETTDGDDTILTVSDVFSGVDFEQIQGITPDEVDPETGTIRFHTPDKSQKIQIPDQSGNVLILTIPEQSK